MSKRYIIAVLACLLALTASPAHALAPSRSSEDPLRFAFVRDPQTIYVRPGDLAQHVFADQPTSDPANLSIDQDEYCNARWLTIAPPPADIAQLILSENQQTTSTYWANLDAWMYSMSMEGTLPIWVIDDRLLTVCQQEPRLLDALTSRIRLQARQGFSAPAIVFDAPRRGNESRRMVDHLMKSGFPGMIGARIRFSAPSVARTVPWDFVVCDEELIPVHYRGQAAAAWVRSQVGQIPVILSPEKFDFLRDVTWLACGVGGIWYRPLPAGGTRENEVAAIHLRASTAFLNRFSNGVIPMAPRWDDGLFHFCLEDPGDTWAGIIPAGTAPASIPAPGDLRGRLVGQSWYNPATDQSIIRPLTPLPDTVSVQPPDANLWVYSISAAIPGAEDNTTITTIRDWPD